jgi:hypothetical protein
VVEPVAEAVVVGPVEHWSESCCPAVAEKQTAVEDPQSAGLLLEAALAEELKVATVVQLSDHCAWRESRLGRNR